MAKRDPRSPFPYPDKKLTKNSNGLLILHFAISLRRPFTIADLKFMSPKKFREPHIVNRYLKQLVEWKLLDQVDTTHYQVNDEGRLFVNMVASYYAQWNTNRAQLGRKKINN